MKKYIALPFVILLLDSSSIVTEKRLLITWIPINVSTEFGSGTKKMSPKELVKAGLFEERNGDLIPTEKYVMLKKTDGLKKYGIN
jgi:hypothetical protein